MKSAGLARFLKKFHLLTSERICQHNKTWMTENFQQAKYLFELKLQIKQWDYDLLCYCVNIIHIN